MKSKTQRFKTARDLGLSEVEMEMIRQKKRLIKQLKEARAKKGLSQAEIARLVGTKQPAIARMEAGQVKVQVSMDFLLRAALVLGVSVVIRPTKAAA